MVQVWPTETFAVRNAVSWDYPDRYLCATVLDDAFGEIIGLSDTKTLDGKPGILYAYGTNDTVPHFPSYKLRGAFQHHNGQRDTRALYCCVERDFWSADCEVYGHFDMNVTGSAAPLSVDRGVLHGYFLFARVRNGVLRLGSAVGDSANPRQVIDRPDGIFFGHMQNGVTGLARPDKFVLGVTVPGTGKMQVLYETEVQLTSAVYAGALYTSQKWGHFEPNTLRMNVTGTRVRCYAQLGNIRPTPYTAIDSSLLGQGSGTQEVLIFDVTDATNFPSAIGRSGFAMQGFERDSSPDFQAFMTINFFTIFDGAGDVYLLDEFRRNLPAASYLVPNHATYPLQQRGGYSLMSAWTGDGMGRGQDTGSGTLGSTSAQARHHSQLLGDNTNDYVSLGRDIDASTPFATDESQNYGWYISQNPAQSPQQRYKTTVTIASATQYEVGIALRFTPGKSNLLGDDYILKSQFRTSALDPSSLLSTDGLHVGYTAIVSLVGGQANVRIDRYGADVLEGPPWPDGTTIASLDISDPGASFELDFQCRNIGDPGLEMVLMQVKIDAVAQNLVPTSGVAGISVEGSWTTDISNFRVVGGGGTGFFYEIKSDTWIADSVRFGNFTADDVEIPDEPPPEDYATIPLDAEDTSKSGELTLGLVWDIEEEPCVGGRPVLTQSNYMFDGPTLSRIRQRWTVRATGAPYTEIDELLALWESNGPKIPFDWTRADTGETFVVRFTGPVIRHTHTATVGGLGAEETRFTLESQYDDAFFNVLA